MVSGNEDIEKYIDASRKAADRSCAYCLEIKTKVDHLVLEELRASMHSDWLAQNVDGWDGPQIKHLLANLEQLNALSKKQSWDILNYIEGKALSSRISWQASRILQIIDRMTDRARKENGEDSSHGKLIELKKSLSLDANDED